MVYIVENNGVYGLTKGQFSATADKGSKARRGAVNTDSPIDLVALALQLGASFVARSFSGDKAQLVPLIKAAIEHKGAAFIDVISPCVAFNNNPESTKSFDYVRAHNEAVNRLDVIVGRDEIIADYAPGTVETVVQHDGSMLRLRKLAVDYDPCDRISALTYLQQRHAAGEVVTGLLFVEPDSGDMHEFLDTVESAAQRARRSRALPRPRRPRPLQRRAPVEARGLPNPLTAMLRRSAQPASTAPRLSRTLSRPPEVLIRYNAAYR